MRILSNRLFLPASHNASLSLLPSSTFATISFPPPRGIDRDLVHEAVFALLSAKVQAGQWTAESATALVQRYTYQKKLDAPSATILSLVPALERFQVCIDFFTIDFLHHTTDCKDFLHLGGAHFKDVSALPPSHLETRRIQCSFYLFELYCNLFGKASNLSFGSDDWAYSPHDLFSNFAPWELEQLACVNDYLMRRMRNGKYISLLALTSSLLLLF